MTAIAPEPGALCSAAKKGDIEGVKKLLAQGADPNERDIGGTSPLIYALSRPFEMVELLVTAGANVNAKTRAGIPALKCCIMNSTTNTDSADMLRLLIDKGASLEEDPANMPLLLWTQASGSKQAVEIIKEALEQKAAQERLSALHDNAMARQAALNNRRPKVILKNTP